MRFLTSLSTSLIVITLSSKLLGQAADLATQLPPDVNAIIAVDVATVAKSAVAVNGQWFDEGKAVDGDRLFLPKGTQRAVIGTMIDGKQDIVYGVSIAELDAPPSLDAIAQADGGHTETIGGKPAATSRTGTYFVAIGANKLATIFPGNRQMAARVAGGAYAGASSPYLKAAINNGAAGLTMAIDADGMISAGDAHMILDARPVKALDDAKIEPRAFAKLMSTLKGVTLHVAFGDDAAGTMTVDFASDAGLLANAVKPVVIEMLSRQGLNVVEFSNWTYAVSGKQITGEGKLSAFTLKRLMSYADAPVPSALNPEWMPSTPDKATPSVADSSLAYFKKITAIMDGVRKAPSLGEQATWLRRDAKRIADMPILNVDPALVAWGTDVSNQLVAASRQLADGQRAVRTTSNTIDKPIAPQTYKTQRGYYYQENSDDAQYRSEMENYRRDMRAATGAGFEAAVKSAAATLDGLAASRTAIRQSMTAKYGVEF